MSLEGGFLSLKKLLVLLFFMALSFLTISPYETTAATNGKVGVVYSELTESYANISRAGGTYKGNWVDAKVDYSSVKDKRIKTRLILEEQGYEVAYINGKDLANVNVLKRYDSIVFPNTVLMTKEQRFAVKEYIKQGGGAIFAFVPGRNEAAAYPWNTNDLDLTPLIYHTGTWVYEWDNLSEVFQSKFVNDVQVNKYTISNVGQHPIVKNTQSKLGKNSINLNDTRSLGQGEWIEVIHPYPNAKVTPILAYSKFLSASAPQHVRAGTGAAYAIEYGKGKVVYFAFKVLDYMGTDRTPTNESWEDNTKGQAWSGLQGGEDLKVLFGESVKWAGTTNAVSHPIDRSVDIQLTDVKAYARANDYIFYGTMTAKTTGNMINRGTMRVEIVSPSGKILNSYERQIIGLTPSGNKEVSSHSEKIQLSIPRRPANGHYYMRAYFTTSATLNDFTGRKITGAKIAGDIRKITIQNNATKSISSTVFTDVSAKHWAYKDITTLAASGVLGNTYNNSYNPGGPISRLDAATMIVNTLGIPVAKRPNPNMADMKPGQNGYDVIAAVVAEGIFSGKNGSFKPNDPLTRGEMTKILVNAFKLTGSTPNNFTDVAKGHWSEPYVEKLVFNKITNVKGQYRPGAKTTRAEFSAFLKRSATVYERP